MEPRMQEQLDHRKFVLLLTRKIGWTFLGALFGTCIFAGIYYLKTEILNGARPYRSAAMYEITFDRDQVDNIHDYYNDYTWNDILDSDQIAGKVAERLDGYSKEQIAEAAWIPTMSDIRFIWVNVDIPDKEQAKLIQETLQSVLEEFAGVTPGIQSITLYDQKAVVPVQEKSLIFRMSIAGGVIGFLVALFVLAYRIVLDDSIYTEQDVTDKIGILPAGVIMKSFSGDKKLDFFKEELQGNLKELLKDIPSKTVGLLGTEEVISSEANRRSQDCDTYEPEKKYLEDILKEDNYTFEIIDKNSIKTYGKGSQAWILLVPYGKQTGEYLKLLWKDWTIAKTLPVAVVITGAEEGFYRKYY